MAERDERVPPRPPIEPVGVATPLRTIVDQLPFGIAVFDDQLRYRHVNPRLAEINGAPVDAHLGRRSGDVLPAPVAAQVDELLTRVLRSGEPLLDLVMSGQDRRRPSEEVTSRASYVPITDAAGEVVGVAAVIEDVTAEHANRGRALVLMSLAQVLVGARSVDDAAGMLLDALVPDVAPGGSVTMLGVDGRPTSSTIAGDAPPELLAGPPHDDADATTRQVSVVQVLDRGTLAAIPLHHPDQADRALGVLRLVWPGGHHVDADELVMFDTLAAIAGVAVGRIEATEALARDRFRGALDAMLDDVAIGTAVRDENGRIVDFVLVHLNRGSSDGAQRGPDELIGHRVTELYPHWRGSGMFDRFARVVETGEPFIGEELEYGDVIDGRPIHGYWRLQIVPFGDGYLAASRDVTAEVALREEVRRTALLEAQERMAVETLQRVALPTRLVQPDGLAISAAYVPATTATAVGGDWYDNFELPDGRIGLVVGDVAGHGAEAAADMIRARNVLYAHAMTGIEPAAVLARTNHTLGQTSGPGTFTTCCYLRIDPATHHFDWAGAGHPPPLVVGPEGARYLDPGRGTVLGSFPDTSYGQCHGELGPGCSLVLYTDGLIESRESSLDEGLDGLAELVLALPEVSAAAIEALVEQAAVPGDRSDDICVLVISAAP